MPATAVSRNRTRTYARVFGPYLVIATGVIFVHAPAMIPALTSFFASPALVISLFGWFLLLRALALMFLPQHYEAVGLGPHGVLIGRVVFGFVFLLGLWLTWTGWIAKAPEPD